MAVCLKCGSSSTSGLRFCTRCGAELPTIQGTEVFQGQSSGPTRPIEPSSPLNPARQTGPATNDQTTPLSTERLNQPQSYQSTQHFGQPFIPPTQHLQTPVQPQRSGSSTGLIVVAAVSLTILILGGLGVGAWYMFGNKQSGSNTSSASPSLPTPPASSPPSNNSAPVQTPQPLPPPSDQPKVQEPPPSGQPNGQQPPPAKSSDAKAEVVNTLNAWAQSVRAHDFERQMSFYAPTLDFYYLRRNVSIYEVRANRILAFQRFTRMDVELGNVQVEVNQTEDKAAASFDKAWRFEGVRPFSGAVHQLVTLSKYGNRWLITGERDVVNYRK